MEMSDLIRREDAFKAIVGLTTQKTVDDIEILCDASVSDSEGWLGGVRDALRAVEYIPSAEPRKKGEWIERKVYSMTIMDYQHAKCSVCGKYLTTPYQYFFDNYPFCPNCGAEMTR